MGCFESKPEETRTEQSVNSNPNGHPPQHQQGGGAQAGVEIDLDDERLMQLLAESDDEQGGGVARMSLGNANEVRLSAAPGQPQGGNNAQPPPGTGAQATHVPAQHQGIYGSSTATTNNQDIYGGTNLYGNK